MLKILLELLNITRFVFCSESQGLVEGNVENEGNIGEKIAHTDTDGNPDKALLTNLITQILTGAVLFFLFLFCRKRAPYVYYPNSENRKQHPCYAFTGVINWVEPLLTLEDAKLLGMVGLDSFMLLQTLKLLYRCFAILSIVYVPMLSLIYYFHHLSQKKSLFESVSIQGTESVFAYAVCLILMYATTFFMFYMIFIYYKRYVTLRQIYLVSPASLTSIEILKDLAKHLNSYENSIEFMNLSSRTVLLNRIPAYVKNDQDVFDFVNELGIGEIKSAVLIQDTYFLTRLYEKRDIILQNIEKEINWAFLSMQKYYKKTEKECKDSFKETYSGTLDESAVKIFRYMKFDMEEKVKLLNCFIQHGNKFLTLAGTSTSLLIVYIEQLRYCNQQILEEKERLSKAKETVCDVELVDESENRQSDDHPNNSNNSNHPHGGNGGGSASVGSGKSDESRIFTRKKHHKEVSETSEDAETETNYFQRIYKGFQGKKEEKEDKAEDETESAQKNNLNESSITHKEKNVTKKRYTRTPTQKDVAERGFKKLEVGSNEDEDIKYEEFEQKVSNNIMPDVGRAVFVRADLKKDVSFFSFDQLKNFSQYKDYFTLNLPMNKRKAFVTFVEAKQSGLIKQSQIGTRVFSPSAVGAPAPNDIIWKNLTKTEIGAFLGKLGSTFIFVSYNILFYFTVSTIVKMLGLKNADTNFLLRKIKSSETLTAWYEGFVTPAVYNICIAISPFVIDFLINMEGIYSYSMSQIRLMKLYSIFLYYNAFLSIFFSTSFFNMLNNFLTDNSYKVENFLQDLGSGYSKYSLFFMNTTIQRILTGSALTLLKPGPFFINFIVYHLQKRTRRQEAELHLSPPLDFGNVMPNVLLVFAITLSYGCVCPIMLFLGFIYYYLNYFVYKNELVYSQRNAYESGGVFWSETSMFLILGVLAFQLSTIASLFAENYKYVLYFTFPLLVLDFYFYDALRVLFDKNIKCYPINEPEEEFLDEFSKIFLEERREMLETWDDKETTEDEDKFPITELGLHDRNIVTNTSYYKDPSTVVNISHILLPSNFYIIVHFLRTFDYKNVFGFNYEAMQNDYIGEETQHV